MDMYQEQRGKRIYGDDPQNSRTYRGSMTSSQHSQYSNTETNYQSHGHRTRFVDKLPLPGFLVANSHKNPHTYREPTTNSSAEGNYSQYSNVEASHQAYGHRINNPKKAYTYGVSTTNSLAEENYSQHPNFEMANNFPTSGYSVTKGGTAGFSFRRNSCKDHESMLHELTNRNQILEVKNKKLEEEKRSLTNELQSLHNAVTIEGRESNQKILDLQGTIESLKAINEEKEEKIRDLENRQAQDLVVKSLQELIKEKEVEVHSLRKHNSELREEASHYQSALGEATNFQMGDDDQNNAVQLKNDIEKLQDMIEDYVTNLKIGVNINSEKIKEILEYYKCETGPRGPDRLLIKATLQFHVIKSIFFLAEDFFSKGGSLESEIAGRRKELSDLLESFSAERLGNDEATRVSSIKLRQLINATLGNRGFSQMKNHENGFMEHQFITSASEQLNQWMDQYRTIKDMEKKKEVERLSPEIIRDTVRLFYFRFSVQEPKIEYCWFSPNSKIQKNYMKGQWDDEEIENLTVGICYFPLIGKNFDKENFKIYTPAKVYPQEIKRRN
ncbi:3627_t:CDS:1 [Acaulospora morrowiae]|uniref:3627_t:CDS:1 n=1 Tax=Acaulospora morrowiae TaxID=94023 RepID=A0A9N8YTM5_9GLOM|nr:3627_t:CDS:1 [Acaulospora morrowiae]